MLHCKLVYLSLQVWLTRGYVIFVCSARRHLLDLKLDVVPPSLPPRLRGPWEAGAHQLAVVLGTQVLP